MMKRGFSAVSACFSSSGLTVEGKGVWASVARFPDSVLRGISQVMLQDNSYAGLLFCVGIFYNSVLFGLGALLGASVSTMTAMLLKADRTLVRQGIYGFNGALVAVALLFFLKPVFLTWVCVLLAASASTILMLAMSSLLRVWKVPALTAPFVFVSLCFFLAAARFGRLEPTNLLPTAGIPKGANVEGVVSVSSLGEGMLNGIGQIFFQENTLTGVFFAAGLFVASRYACMAAITGSLLGAMVGWVMGAAEPAIRAGVYGFNSALVAIALGAVFLTGVSGARRLAFMGALITPFVYAALSAALEPVGMPALTLPFVLVTWVFILSSRTTASNSA